MNSSNIRRHSIISSIIIYFGFTIGLINTYFFAKEGLFTKEEYGLYGLFIAVASVMASFANLAMPSFIYKFYPYYNDNLPVKKNDMLSLSLFISIIGFIVVLAGGIFFQDMVIRKYGENSELFVNYYYLIFPISLGLTLYNVLEAYTWNLHKSIVTNFVKEVEWRFIITILIVLFIFRILPDFGWFVKGFSFSYLVIALTLLIYLLFTRKVHFTFSLSKVTRKFSKNIYRFCSFIFGANVIFAITQAFDTMVIASVLPDGLGKAAIYTLVQYFSSVVQAPQRGIIAASIPHLAQSWKDKKVDNIQRIYQRSSINLLIFSCVIFVLIAANFTDAIKTIPLNQDYLAGFIVFILLGITKIIDMGTGVNGQIIGTSRYWKFELTSGIILLLFMLPLNYFLTKKMDIMGTALAGLIYMTIYNFIRILFLWQKFRLFPFTVKSVYTILLTITVYFFAFYFFNNMNGWLAMVIRSVVIVSLFASGVVILKLTPDLRPVLQTILKRLGKK
jgi:O-antigen/teichoic acid export membrane protein